MGVLLDFLRESRKFRGVDRRIVYMADKVDVDLHHEDEYGAVEVKGLYNQM